MSYAVWAIVQRLRLAFVILILMTACSGKSGEEDVSAVLQKEVRGQIVAAHDKARRDGGGHTAQPVRAMRLPAPEDFYVDNVEVLETEELENGHYRMRFAMDSGMGERSSSDSGEIIVHNTEKGWKAQL